MISRLLPASVAAFLGAALTLCPPHVRAAEKKKESKAPGEQLLLTTNLLEAHFHFTAEQWREMMPPDSGGGPFIRPLGGGRGGPGGPGRPGGPGFGPGMFLAPAFMKAADANEDGRISREEFGALSEKWFESWDKKHHGKLTEDDLREGLNTSLAAGPGPGRMGPMLQGAEGKRNGLSSAAGVEFKYVHADLELNGKKFTDVAVRYKGNGTWMESRNSEKRSMKADLNEFVKGQKISGLDRLNFHNCVTDASYMNEVLSYRLYRDAGVPAPRTAYARVYLDVPGEHKGKYLGVYSVVENVDTRFIDQRFDTKKGAIFKPVTPAPFTYLGADWSRYNQIYDAKTDLTDAQKERLIAFCRLVSQAGDSEFNSKLPDFLDLDNFSRYMAVTVWLSTLDSILGIGQNYYVYQHAKTGKLHFIPWDLDHSFGQFPMVGSQEQREKLSIRKPWQGENRFLERVFNHPEFQKLYRARMEEFSKTIFSPERLAAQVDEIARVIRPAVAQESAEKLARFDKVVAGEEVPPRFFGAPGGGNRGPGGGRPGFGPFGQGMKPIKTFSKARHQSVLEQLAGKSQGETLEFGFPGRGGPGRGPGGFGPGMFLAGAFNAQLDADRNGEVSKDEFKSGMARWFSDWDEKKEGVLTEEQLREGLNRTFRPPVPPE